MVEFKLIYLIFIKPTYQPGIDNNSHLLYGRAKSLNSGFVLPMPSNHNIQIIDNLYRDHNVWLSRQLRGQLGCCETAADLVHDTFVYILKKDQAAEIRNPRAYLTTIANRVLLNYWRRERLKSAYLEALARRTPEPAISLEEQAILIETLVRIDRLLSGLPVIVRRAFFHAQLDGMKHSDIALELNVSVSTVKRYLHKAAMRCYFACSD